MESWQVRAATFQAHACDPVAAAYTTAANELAAALIEHANATLDLQSAAQESGFHPDTLRHRLAAGTLPNAGRTGAPRIRRADLPRKPGRKSTLAAAGGYDPQQDARSLLARMK